MSEEKANRDVDTRQVIDEQGTQALDEGTLSRGTVLQGRYGIIKVLGVGGMGAVYQARDLRFTDVTKLCAVKEMFSPTMDPRARQMSIESFNREANILASLSHPSIPKIFDYFSEAKRSYLVLEFIDGQDLEALLRETTSFVPADQVVQWAIEICDVLAYLHQHKPDPIIFRDLKPSNIMLNQHGHIVLIDFGIAKVFEIGQKGTMIGTEGYSPPEQYRGQAEPRGDLYALGATLHHLLTKRDPRLEPPFTFHERPIRSINPDVPEQIEAVIMRALEYDVDKRFGSAQEMQQALIKASLQHKVIATASLGASTTVISAGPGQAEGVLPVWQFACEDEVRSSPYVYDGVVYAGAYDNNLYALDAKSGEFQWKFATDGGVASSPCVWRDQVIFGSEDHLLYAVSRKSGRIVWSCPTNGRIRSSPRIEYDHVFFGSDDGFLYVVSAMSGRIVWKYQTENAIRSSAALSKEAVYFGSDDGYLYALDIQTGGLKWRFHTGQAVISSPCLHENIVFVGSLDRHIYAVDAGSGWAVWRYRTGQPVISSPTVFEDRVYVGSVDGHLYCLDAKSGRLIWKYGAGSQVTSSPAATVQGIYFGTGKGKVVCVDLKGKLRWEFQTGGPVPSSPATADGLVYIGSVDHHVYALLM